MTTHAAQEIKKRVRERYANIAREASACCGPTTDDVISLVDYGELTDQIPEEADLGLGCGAPTQFASLQPGETVLDLGSGAGIDVFLAANAVGPTGRALGIDMTPEMIARARENARKGGYENVEFRLGELENMPIEDESIDVILSNCVINLTPDKMQVFREMHRVLKPGGRFSISDIVTFGQVPEAIRRDMELWAGCVAGAIDRDEYLKMLNEAGFRNVRVEKEVRYGADMLPLEKREALSNTDPNNYGLLSITLVGEK
ncbi:MAG: arsenite methyltransferase [Chloroflexi bacterium]|nr:arsenite methyltransferase [Chloroflexota bacterium]